MKLKLKLMLLGIAASMISGTPAASPIKLGVYDFNHTFDNVRTIGIEHLWYRWDSWDTTDLFTQLKKVVAKGRVPLITVEPWAIGVIGDTATLLPDIADGKYDATAYSLAVTFNTLHTFIYLRWGHEMECVPTYPWSQRDPSEYIAAFRRVAAIFKEVAPMVKMLWSPVGNKDCGKYYPGDDVVDYVGFTVFEFPQVSMGWFGHVQSFAGWMDEKYPRVAVFHKPVVIAELGIFDKPAKQKAWMQAAFASMKNYPLLHAIIYFNSRDSASWAIWGGTEIPNWSIDPDVFL